VSTRTSILVEHAYYKAVRVLIREDENFQQVAAIVGERSRHELGPPRAHNYVKEEFSRFLVINMYMVWNEWHNYNLDDFISDLTM
jgi:hypothetical protein